MKIYSKNRKKGSILVTILFMVSVLALLVATVANDSFQTMKTVSQSGRDTQAKYAAYAGLEYALNELRKDEYFYGQAVGDQERHGRIARTLEEGSNISYEVDLWNNIQDLSLIHI